ncbi:unnamed protein product [Candidula unifasciata]|uniref:RAD51 interacting motif domain-containing protein n=1 Tax=Candidula unifasciata TaxID=100452 RepID=A0A8S3YXQ3_9EUPU|nr:unnamed protein product [Candidula unifasciata]
MDDRTGGNDGMVDTDTGVTNGRLCNSTGVTDGDVDSETASNDSAVGNSTGITEGHDMCKDSRQTVLASVQELHSTVIITEPADNNRDLTNHKTSSSCNICHQGSSIGISLEILPDPHQREETTTETSVTNDALLLYKSEQQAHSHHSEQISLIPSLEHSAACEEQKVPEAESCEDLSLSEVSMYSNLATDEPGDLKCKNQTKQAFQWNSVYESAMNKSLTDQSSDSTVDGLSAIVPIAHSHRPLRIGLSRKQKVKRLHNKQ